jgi:hypothetical protein
MIPEQGTVIDGLLAGFMLGVFVSTLVVLRPWRRNDP